MGIELDTTKKVELGVVLALFLLAGAMLWYNWDRIRGTRADDTVNGWTETKKVGQDPTQKISPTNPEDPVKTTITSTFICTDGSLQLIEYPNDPTRGTTVIFRADRQKKKFALYAPPQQDLQTITDPTRRALTWAATVLPRTWAADMLARRGEFNADQLKAEKDARQAALDKMATLDTQASNGSAEPKTYQDLLDALARYKANPDDPTKSATKKKIGQDVIKSALAYLNKIQRDRDVVVDEYVSAVEKILVDDEQKKKLADAVPARYLNRVFRAG